MPQIANQDYNTLRLNYSNAAYTDAGILALIAGHIERGTIYDTVIEIYSNDFGRVCGVDIQDGYPKIGGMDAADGSSWGIEVPYTPTQYEGLAAVQVACEMTGEIPGLQVDDNSYLQEGSTGSYLCVSGKCVQVTVDDYSAIAALTIVDSVPASGEDWVNVPFEELQKLIGIPLL